MRKLKFKPKVITPFWITSVLAMLWGALLFLGGTGIVLLHQSTGYGESLRGGDGADIAALMGIITFGISLLAYIVECGLIALYFHNDRTYSRKRIVWIVQFFVIALFFTFYIGSTNKPRHILHIGKDINYFVVIQNYPGEKIAFSFSNYDKEAFIDTNGQLVFEVEDKLYRRSDYKGNFNMLSERGGKISTSKGSYWKHLYTTNGYKLTARDSNDIDRKIEKELGTLLDER
ncbi:MAG: hypothetical protein MK212_21925 [Saprospiraceae bacterium]|nr:hypothetical protein [Saprospiraceae bacterium]